MKWENSRKIYCIGNVDCNHVEFNIYRSQYPFCLPLFLSHSPSLTHVLSIDCHLLDLILSIFAVIPFREIPIFVAFIARRTNFSVDMTFKINKLKRDLMVLKILRIVILCSFCMCKALSSVIRFMDMYYNFPLNGYFYDYTSPL